VTSKSPLTGTIAVSMTGGFFPAELKFAGYDILIIEGKADQPVYIVIHKGKAAIRPAKHLWGMKSVDCEHILKEQLGTTTIGSHVSVLRANGWAAWPTL